MEDKRWLAVPLYNLPLREEVLLNRGRLVPTVPYREAADLIRKHRVRNEFVSTAALIIGLDDQLATNKNPQEELWPDIGPVVSALEFLFQRHVGGYTWSIHQTPDCRDESECWGMHAHLLSVPDGPEIRVHGDQGSVIRDTVALWRDDELAERTAFRYAFAIQLMAQADEVAFEIRYIQQWLAFEVLVQRWTDTDATAPRDVHIVDSAVRKAREAIRRSLQPLCECGVLSTDQVTAVIGSVRSNIYRSIGEKAMAFLRGHGIDGIEREWLDECLQMRNDLVHGRSLTEIAERMGREDASQEMHWRGMALNRIVNWFIMGLMGYRPRGSFEPYGSEWYCRTGD